MKVDYPIKVICIESLPNGSPITINKIYMVVASLMEPDGQYIVECDGRKLIAPRRFFQILSENRIDKLNKLGIF
jgi:hypothetical protein